MKRRNLAYEIELVESQLRSMSAAEREDNIHLQNRLTRLIAELAKLGVYLAEPTFN